MMPIFTLSIMIEEALHQIPIRHDFFTELFLIASVQAILMAIVVLIKSKLKNQILLLLSFFLFAMSALILDLYLARSGWMRALIWYNDATEWLVLCLGPSLYLIGKALFHKSTLKVRIVALHFLVPLSYLLYQSFYFLQPIEHKFNAYIGAFQSQLDFLEYHQTFQSDPLGLKEQFERILLLSIILYAIAGIWMIFKSKVFPSWSEVTASFSKYTFLLWSFGSLITNGISLFFLFLLTEEIDSHTYIGVITSVEVMLLLLLFLGESTVFTSSWVADKYDTASIKEPMIKKIMAEITKVMEQNAPFLTPKYTLTQLSLAIGFPTNSISQAINVTQEKNFNDFINGYRVERAKELLESGASEHLTIEGIGRDVGFSSKSAFYAAFKKVTGQTPLAYKNRSL